MSRIKLKELLSNVTEQAPQPPPEQAAEPAAPAVQQIGQPPAEPTPEMPAPGGTDAPPPENAGEYDFTRDFKTFESTIEKAKQQAKKKFLDRMNQYVKDKKVTVNASRGYGQPQKDYTIDKVTKGSVDWYYNKNVVVLTDENGKEYFLTPGVNIKIEAGAAPAEEPQAKGQDQAPAEPPKMKQPEPEPQAEPPAAEQPPPAGAPGAEQPATPPAPDAALGATPPPEQKPEQPAPEDQQAQLKKKKKVPAPAPAMEEDHQQDVWEVKLKNGGYYVLRDGDTMGGPFDTEKSARDWMADKKNQLPETTMEEDVVAPGSQPLKADDVASMNDLFGAFVPENKRDRFGRFDVRPYFKKGSTEGAGDSWTTEFTIEIPADVFGGQLDMREFKLEATDYMRHYQGPGGEFSRGRVDVQKNGRYYVFDFYESGGLDI